MNIKVKFYLLRKIVILFCLFVCLNSYADLVSTVYRADSRPPEDVFKNGFTAWGNNINYLSHIAGFSTASKEKNSAFIATSTSKDFVKKYARKMATVVPDHIYYFYEIRATDNFYSAQATIEHITKLKGVSVSPVTKKMLDEQKEYSALTYISPAQIKSVFILQYVPPDTILIANKENENYVSKATYANENPYTGSDIYPWSFKPILFIGPPLLPASFESDSKENYTSTPWPIIIPFLNEEL